VPDAVEVGDEAELKLNGRASAAVKLVLENFEGSKLFGIVRRTWKENR
jgi:hypothetical protein